MSRNSQRKATGLERQKPSPADPAIDTAGGTNGLNFSTPTEHVDLPSGGVFYPENHPLHGKDSVEIKYMTAKEEDILTSRSLLRKGLALERLLESILLDKTINPRDLLVGDRNAILIASRITGFGPEYETQVTCPSCNTSSEYTFDLGEVKAKEREIPPEITQTSEGTFLLDLPSTQVQVELKLMTGVDEQKISQRQESKKKHKLPESPLTDQLRMIIKSANGHQEHSIINSLIENMPSKDTRYLRRMYDKITPNIDMSQNFECPSCFSVTDLEVPFTVAFFWPK